MSEALQEYLLELKQRFPPPEPQQRAAASATAGAAGGAPPGSDPGTYQQLLEQAELLVSQKVVLGGKELTILQARHKGTKAVAFYLHNDLSVRCMLTAGPPRTPSTHSRRHNCSAEH